MTNTNRDAGVSGHGGFAALWDTSDQWHSAAETAFVGFRDQNRRLLTTSFVLLECGNAAARRPYRSAVCRLRDSLSAAQMLIEPTGEEVEKAWVNFRNGDMHQPGIVDQVSFAVMRRLGLSDAFTNDRHFRAAGFNVLF
ncbi:MAG: hypothetical protein ABIZ49_08310 [Opitutaceae bacterium]